MSVTDKEITLLTPHLVECCVLKLNMFFFVSWFLLNLKITVKTASHASGDLCALGLMFLFRKYCRSHIVTSHATAQALEVMYSFEGGVDLHGLRVYILGRVRVELVGISLHAWMCICDCVMTA